MRQLLLILAIFTLTANILFAQDIPEGTLHIKYLDVVFFENGDTAKFKRSTTYYDSNWTVLSNNSSIGATLSPGTKTVTVIDQPDKKMYSDINADGDTTTSIVYLYDAMGNRTHNFQITKGDTTVRQKRTYDEQGNNLELWNYRNGEYMLYFKNTYDDSNNVVQRITYDSYGSLLKTEKTVIDYEKGTYKTYTKVPGEPKVQTKNITIVDGIERSDIFRTRKAINYGVWLQFEQGGYTLRKEKDDNLVWLEIYDAKGNLTTKVHIHYKTLD